MGPHARAIPGVARNEPRPCVRRSRAVHGGRRSLPALAAPRRSRNRVGLRGRFGSRELYGLDVRAGVRQSLFRYFHGRSSLATWLRAVLAQRFVDAKRSTRRLEPLPDAELEETRESAAFAVGTDPDAPRLVGLLREALKAALSELPARDRLRMACYHAREMTLATIGRELGEHEATVSRHLARTRREIRAGVERRLRDDHGLNAEAIELCWRAVLADTGDLDVGAMMDLSRKDPSPDRSERKEGV